MVPEQMSAERLAEIRERHERIALILVGPLPDSAHTDRGELLAEVDRLRTEIRFHRGRADDADGRQAEAAQYSSKIEAEVVTLRERVAALSETVAFLRSCIRSGESLNADDDARIDAALTVSQS